MKQRTYIGLLKIQLRFFFWFYTFFYIFPASFFSSSCGFSLSSAYSLPFCRLCFSGHLRHLFSYVRKGDAFLVLNAAKPKPAFEGLGSALNCSDSIAGPSLPQFWTLLSGARSVHSCPLVNTSPTCNCAFTKCFPLWITTIHWEKFSLPIC